MNSSLQMAGAWLFWLSGLGWLARKINFSYARFVVLFHGVATRRYRQYPRAIQPMMTTEELRNTLLWLRRSRFDFLTPQELLSSDQPGLLLTFDDGFANNCTNVLPVLEEFGAPAVFFITTQHVKDSRNWLWATRSKLENVEIDEKKVPEEVARDLFDGMNAEQLVACSQNPLITIGSHAVSHPLLTKCTTVELAYELAESKRFLEEITGREVKLFAYPTGDYNRLVAEAVQSAGYTAGFAVDSHKVGLAQFEIPRIGIYNHRASYLGAKLSGIYRAPLNGPIIAQ